MGECKFSLSEKEPLLLFAASALRLSLTGVSLARGVFGLVKRFSNLVRAIVEALDQVGGHVSAEARRGRLQIRAQRGRLFRHTSKLAVRGVEFIYQVSLPLGNLTSFVCSAQWLLSRRKNLRRVANHPRRHIVFLRGVFKSSELLFDFGAMLLEIRDLIVRGEPVAWRIQLQADSSPGESVGRSARAKFTQTLFLRGDLAKLGLKPATTPICTRA